MPVLPYRVRQFIRHNLTWYNIRFQWFLVGLFFITLGSIGLWLAWNLLGLLWLLLNLGIATQFFVSSYVFPYPSNEPMAIRYYMSLRRWWREFSEPAQIGEFEGRPVLERWDLIDFRSIYDGDGRLIATEQEIDWSSTDLGWRPRDQRHIEMIATRFDGSERLSWLARLRSPRLPVGQQAEIVVNSKIVGQTTYSKGD